MQLKRLYVHVLNSFHVFFKRKNIIIIIVYLVVLYVKKQKILVRERPQIFFNASTGAPAVLFNGVCPGRKYDYAYTMAQDLYQ